MALTRALEFAPGTTDHSQQVIVGMFDPGQLYRAYRTARAEHGTADVVLICPDLNPENMLAGPRKQMAAHLTRLFGKRAAEFKMTSESAHTVVKIPKDGDAMWLLINVPNSDMPLMVVLYALKYEQVAEGVPMIGEG